MVDPILENTNLDYLTIRKWFNKSEGENFLRITVPAEYALQFGQLLGLPIRRCYISDNRLTERLALGVATTAEIVAAALPNAGSTMAGDFGEVLSYIFHLSDSQEVELTGPKKWRLKQDRTKPSPKSDVVHFALPDWPNAGESDGILCSEVKVKSTNGASRPISTSLTDSKKDRTSRFADTLVWLRERTILGDDTDVSLEQLARFIDAIDYPQYEKSFYAVAVICEELVDAELEADPPVPDVNHQILVIVVPSLRDVYTSVFNSASNSFLPQDQN